MPQAITHFLISAFIAALIRDYLIKKKGSKIPLHYVFITGIGGVLPDIDLIAYLFLYPFGFTIQQVHRGITHSIFFILLFVILGLLTLKVEPKKLRKHHLYLSTIFFLLSFGIFTHVALDSLIIGHDIKPFYPLSSYPIGIDLVKLYIPEPIQDLIPPLLDGIIFLLWIAYLEFKHKISDYI